MLTAHVPCPNCGESLDIPIDIKLGDVDEVDGRLHVDVSPVIGEEASMALAEHMAVRECVL